MVCSGVIEVAVSSAETEKLRISKKELLKL